MRPAAESSERDANANGLPPDVTAEAVRAALDKILASPGFANADRLSRFLRYAVEEALNGHNDKLKESMLGVEVFGRKPTYDPRVDAVVRTEAVKLRARLRDYYESEGSADPLIIDLPKGGYVPAYRLRGREPKDAAVPHAAAPDAAVEQINPAWWKPALIAALLVLVVVGASWYALRRRSRAADARAPELSSIAVLPFADLSPERNQEYFCDGMTEEIIDALTKAGGFRVVARTSSFAFKGTQQDVREIGKKLNVGAVLEGSVRKDGNLLRVTAQLNSVSDGYHLWSVTYERELKDVFTVQDEISRAIVNTLQTALAGSPRRIRSSAPENLETYDLYLRGRFHWGRWRMEGAESAIQFFEKAIAKDPKYAAAYAGLADSYCWMGFFGALPPNEAMPRARQFAEKALALDDSLAEAHTSLAFVKTLYEFEWKGAEREFKRAIELNPNSPEAHFGYGITYLCPMGKTAEGLKQMKLAKDLDPLSMVTNTYLGLALMFDHQHDAAVDQFRKALSLDPNFAEAHLSLASCYLDSRDYGSFYSELEKARGQAPDWRIELSHAYGDAAQGHKDAALSTVRKWEHFADGAYVRPSSIASVYAMLGDRDKMFFWLEKAYAGRDGVLPYLAEEHMFRPYRTDPRFIALFRKVGLPN
jgi:TolB-like protein/Tfp pilus assembly protein PilF